VTETTYVTSVDLRANSGTHHIILWEDQPDSGPAAEPTAFDADDSLCANDFGLKSFRIGAQDADFVQSLPDNVSFTIEPGKVFGFNVHYTNPFNVPIQPEVWVNFNGTATPTAREAADIFPGDLSFSVPPGTIGTGNLVSYEYPWSWPGCFFFLTSHMHRRGTEFKAWTSKPSSWSDTTDLIYDSTDWDHPVVLDPWPRLMLSQGDKLWFQCQFDNGVFADVTRRCRPLGASACGLFNDYVCVTDADCGAGTTGVCEDCPLDFGFLSEDEMCFMPGLYYPATYGTPTCPW
jgi:hypothetical protein